MADPSRASEGRGGGTRVQLAGGGAADPGRLANLEGVGEQSRVSGALTHEERVRLETLLGNVPPAAEPADARALPVRVEGDTLVGAEHAPALDADQRPRPLRRQGGAEEAWCTSTVTAHERYHYWITL